MHTPNYINASVNWTLSHSVTHRRKAVFWGKVYLSFGLEGWPLPTNTCWVKVFCQWQTLFFVQKNDQESLGQAGGHSRGTNRRIEASLRYFFPHISYQSYYITFAWSLVQYCASDTTSRGVSALERNFTPRCLRVIHTEAEAENWRRIPPCKRQWE